MSRVERDVVEVIQIAEHAHFAEFRHAGNEQELKIRVGAFDDAVKVFQNALMLEGSGQLVFFQVIYQRLVVLINEQNDLALS